MHISTSSILGVVFLLLSFAATFSMFHMWGYPYDEVKKKSSCPQWKMNIHRGIGFAYVAVYIIMMTEMVPRLWEYQVEFPARTVVHILLGSTIGVILLIKVSIIRFFRHLEEWMPALGVSLLISTVLLAVMSLPAFYRERALAENVYSKENRARVARLLPEAGFPDELDLTDLATEKSLERGRHVLLGKCISCHDLKTVITKARTPSDWVRTSKRMALKPSLSTVISLDDSYFAAAYLIAITPSLQQSAKSKRAEDKEQGENEQEAIELLMDDESDAGVPEAPEPGIDAGPTAAPSLPADPKIETPASTPTAPKPVEAKPKKAKKPKVPYDAAKAKSLFNDECSLCHGLGDVNDAPPTTRKEVSSVLRRMVGNGLDVEKEDLSLIRRYMIRRYVNKK